jgi:anti-anti-sigma factor
MLQKPSGIATKSWRAEYCGPMEAERLVVEFERRTDGGVVLRVSGKLAEPTAPLLDGVLHALRAEATPLVLDLAGVRHIDARGLDLLLAAEAAARRSGSTVEVTGVPESLRSRQPPFA